MRIIIGLFLTIAAAELVRRGKGKWYEYMAVVILGVLVTLGICLL